MMAVETLLKFPTSGKWWKSLIVMCEVFCMHAHDILELPFLAAYASSSYAAYATSAQK